MFWNGRRVIGTKITMMHRMAGRPGQPRIVPVSGLCAAARAGLGVAPHSARLIPPGLVTLPSSRYLPELAEIEFVVIGPGQHHRIASALMAVILSSADRVRKSQPE